ncbi:sensor histidine kinase [Agromyces sp. ZXT2-6]|uniref:sensor histidine kinase n=1 Tax=Agromyces sp. ZXT2-6 TaxID=3461153 RepID=UPI00405504E3
MTLGLPEHLARESLSRALDRAGYAAAFVCLLAGMAIAAASVIDGRAWGLPEPRMSALLVFALIAAQFAAQAILIRWTTVTMTVITLVVGAAVALGITVILMPASDFDDTNNALIALPRVALVLLGGAGVGSRIAITWAALGWGMGEAATLLAVAVVLAGEAGDSADAASIWVPNIGAAAALVIVAVVRTFDGLARRGARRRSVGLYRASRQTRELVIRHDYELRAIARLHDTALSHLVAVAAAGSGPVSERLRAGIRNDLALIVGRDWAIDHVDESAASRGPERAGEAAGDADATATAPFADAVDFAQQAGVRVRVSGDADALRFLGPFRREALEAAVAQCLVNVVRHAGVDEAEVAVGPGDGEVTVAVIDGGAGFDVDAVPSDRIGLRTSIRGRIEHEGGSVQVWSRPGVGTTVLLSMPTGGGDS